MKTSFTSIALVVAVMTGTAGAADSFDAQAEIEALRAEVQQLRAASNDSWLNERRTEEVKGLIREVLADADTRASLAEGGMTAGHNGKKFFLASEDGGFLMNIEGQIQFRWIWSSRDDSDHGGGLDDEIDGNETGFTIRRTKLSFNGHIADPKLHYVVQIEVDRGDNNVQGDIITIGYDLTDTLTITVGEAKAPFLHEEMTSSKRQLAVERSFLNEMFTLDVVQGIFVDWDPHEQVHVSASINDGGKSGEPGSGARVEYIHEILTGGDFDDDTDGKDFDDDYTDFAFTGRVDVLLAGSWSQNKDFTSWSGEEMFARIGGAFHYEENESGHQAGNPEDADDFWMWTIDGAVEYKGFSLFAAYVQMYTDHEESGATDYDPSGFLVQGSYNIDLSNGDNLEPFVRYEHVDFDDAVDDIIGSGYSDEVDILTFGVNWYHKKHAAKFTADVVWAMDGVAEDLGQSGLGILDDNEDTDDQIVVRLQYQLLF